MNLLLDSHKEVLETLITHQVAFMLVGGYAVNYYGYHRMTGDLDLWLAPDNDNKMRLLRSLQELGFDDAGIKEIETWNFEQMQLFSILERPFQVEFMTQISGLNFQESYSQAKEVNMDGLHFRLIQYQDLIRNKQSSGRPKDLLDVDELEKIRKLKEN